MNNEFEIENYRFINDNKIYVSIVRGKLSIPITIPKEQFELWLLIAERLITIMVLNDPQLGNQQTDAVMSKEEYWKLSDEEVHKDLYDFIISHPIVFRGQVYNNPLVSINWSFNSHRATLN